jgi:hypothetical protein
MMLETIKIDWSISASAFIIMIAGLLGMFIAQLYKVIVHRKYKKKFGKLYSQTCFFYDFIQLLIIFSIPHLLLRQNLQIVSIRGCSAFSLKTKSIRYPINC